MAIKKINFANFLKLFPKVELPITLDEHSHHTFSKENKPLPAALIEKFIIPHDKGQIDEFTEYIPCFRIPEQQDFEAVVYWKAMLMDYNYIMITFDKKGNFIQSYHIGGTRSDGHQIARLLSTIHPSLQIDLAAGSSALNQTEYSPTDTKVFKIQLLPNGTANIEMDETIWS